MPGAPPAPAAAQGAQAVVQRVAARRPAPRRWQPVDAAGTTLELYPDGARALLREAIAARYGLNPDRIVCGDGSDDILTLLANAYLGARR